MSTTLSTHPPQQAVQQPQPVVYLAPRPTSRPTLVDKLALRLGLWLITYGRRRYALTREQLVLQHENDQARRMREAEWARVSVRWQLGPR